MSDGSSAFLLHAGGAPPPGRIEATKVVKGFRASQPIGETMDETFVVFPWNQPVAEYPLAAPKGASPYSHPSIVTRPDANAKAARVYAAKTARPLPANLQEDLLRGIGMFKFPLGSGDADDLLQ